MLTVPGQTTHPRMLRAQTIVKRTKDGLRTFMGSSTNSETVEDAVQGLRDCMDELTSALQSLVGSGLDEPLHQEVSEMLMNELSPYLGRVPLMSALSGSQGGIVVGKKVCAAWENKLEGDNPVALLDHWLREQTSMNALAAVPDACITATGRMVDEVVEGPIWVLGADHPIVEQGVQQAGKVRKVVRIDWNPLQPLAEYEESPALVAIPSLLEGIPDRHAIRLLSSVRAALRPGGRVVASALIPSSDAAFTELVLGWSTHRRKPAQLLDLFILAGMAIVADAPSPKPGLVVIAQDKSDAMSNPAEK